MPEMRYSSERETHSHVSKHASGRAMRSILRVYLKQILEHNREEVLRAIDGFQSELEGFKSALFDEDFSELIARLERGKCFRDQL